MKKLIRILALIFIVAALASSIAFAVVPFPTQPPLSQTFIVLPNTTYPSMAPMYASQSSSTAMNRIAPFQEVYTADGSSASATWSASANNRWNYQYVKDGYDTSLIINTGYMHNDNLAPASAMRVVNVGNGALNLCAIAGDHSTGMGYLLSGALVLYVGTSNVSGWVKVRVFDTNSTLFCNEYYVPASGLKAYSR